MAFSIGLRIYHITLHNSDGSPRKSGDMVEFKNFISNFIDQNAEYNNSDELQRGFCFSDSVASDEFNLSGHIRYGTYGFESDIIDTSSMEVVHRRTINQMEEIPLFFKFWFPDGRDFGLAAFQSFSGRSCKQMIVKKIYDEYNKSGTGLKLSFRKIMPSEMRGTGFFASPVKEVTLLKKVVPRDRASAYAADVSSSEFKYRFSIVAKRNGTLGALSDVYSRAVSSGENFLMFEGIQFDEARAVVSIGGRRRMVGLMGYNADAGVIEVSDQVERGGFENLNRSVEWSFRL